MKPTRLARRLWTLTAMRRAMAAALRYNRHATRLQFESTIAVNPTRAHYAEARDWCLAQLNRLTMQEVAA